MPRGRTGDGAEHPTDPYGIRNDQGWGRRCRGRPSTGRSPPPVRRALRLPALRFLLSLQLVDDVHDSRGAFSGTDAVPEVLVSRQAGNPGKRTHVPLK